MSTIEKALGLLEHFSSQTPEIGLSDFKRLTNFDKGTTHRYLSALKDCGFLEQDPTSRAYRLGPAVIRLAAVREKTVPLVKTVARYVDEIASEIHELVHSALPQSNGMSMLYAVDGGNSGTRVAFDESEILPFHATSSGLAFLSFGPQVLRDRILTGDIPTYTAHTPPSAAAVEQRIEETQCLGLAIADQSFETDVASVAAPFFDPDGVATGTIAIATPVARMTDARRAEFSSTLVQTSLDLTHSLGGKVPDALHAIWTSQARPR